MQANFLIFHSPLIFYIYKVGMNRNFIILTNFTSLQLFLIYIVLSYQMLCQKMNGFVCYKIKVLKNALAILISCIFFCLQLLKSKLLTCWVLPIFSLTLIVNDIFFLLTLIVKDIFFLWLCICHWKPLMQG